MLSDIINGVKIIKLHAWEDLFSKLVSEVRKRETRLFLYVRLNQAFQFTQLVYQVKVTTMVMVLAIVLLHKGPGDPIALQSHQLYTLLNYLNSLFLSLTLFLPMCIQAFFDTKVSARRIQDFLLIPEIERERKPHVVDSDVPQLQFYDVSASWNRSSLLQAALGELPHFEGFIMRSDSLAYMPQISWIFPGTVRDNVLCSLPYDQERYAQVLKATTLDVDIKRLLHGDYTQVGERGVSLSGGQKARIGLARIAYSDAMFVLLDDPLAAVDARVANHLFEECICGILSNRLRLLVTHQHHLLPRVDKIMVMQDGAITHFGSYNELIEEGVNFQTLIYNIQRQDNAVPVDLSEINKCRDDENTGSKRRSQNISFQSEDGPACLEVEDLETGLLLSEMANQAESRNKSPVTDVPSKGHPVPGSINFLRGSEDTQNESSVAYSSSQNIDDLCRFMDSSCRSDGVVKRKRTLSSMEPSRRTELQNTAEKSLLTRSMSQGGSKARRRLADQDSVPSVRTLTPRSSITSRLAFSMENALAPGSMMGLDEGTMKVVVDYTDEEDEKRNRLRAIQDVKRDKELGTLEIFSHQKKDFSREEKLVEAEEEEEDTAIAEEWQHGQVKWKHYLILGRIGGGICGFLFAMLLFAVTITNHAGCDLWIAKWAEFVDERAMRNATDSDNQNITMNTDTFPIWDIRDNRVALLIYCCLTVSLVIISSVRSLVFFGILINAAKRLHKGMLNACMQTRLTFFEINPSGRILNRFAKDIGQLDDYLPTTIHDFLQCFFLVVSIGVVTIVESYWIIIPTIPILVLFYITRQYYLCTSRDLKRIESVARSPVFSWVNITIQGLPCIRATKTESLHMQRYNQVMDSHTSVFYMNIAAARWLSIRLDLLCTVYLAAVVTVCLLMGNFSHVSSSEVGLMITYATGLIGLFQWCVRQSAEVENQMVSVERTVEYMDLEPEITESPVMQPPINWPSQGKIVFDGLWLRYNKTASWALRDITLHIEPGQKVGIVGRTGAGKSSLISAIFRLVEAESGQVLVDDVDIAHLDLPELRKRISIIPQDPIMFSGTIRSNLDPDERLSEEAIWSVLASVQLNKVISTLPGGLQAHICEGGTNLSTGQRQLLALARAILGGNRILVVDEATANVDPGTDYVIQKTLRDQFASCTVLTVAHRLHTVIDNELLVVMEGGRIVEVGPPHELLNPELSRLDREQLENDLPPRPDQQVSMAVPVTGVGALASLVRQTGVEEAAVLANMARNAYIETLTHKSKK
ncbi:unnamed protein product [Echinostoma caproni]|uniref:ABC transporter domain-containing protein n=1 Tax=Echinostoma caproni TaxID=27848 RepID=A0A183A7N2_9TREM|nr:unnamed protein product [Echinostoma caproni]